MTASPHQGRQAYGLGVDIRDQTRRFRVKVLFATSEFADYAKAGGLGDVSAGFPRALRRRGIDARVLLPAYPEVIAKAANVSIVADLPGRAGIEPCRIGEVQTADGLTLYVVLAPSLYERMGTPYCGSEGLGSAPAGQRPAFRTTLAGCRPTRAGLRRALLGAGLAARQ